MIKYKLDEILLAILVALFIFISYIKSTIAISYAILFLSSFILIYKFYNDKESIKKVEIPKSALYLFFALALWVILQPLFFFTSIEVLSKALGEIKGQFLTPVLFFILGFFLIKLTKHLTLRIIVNIIYFTGLIHILIIIGMALYFYFTRDILPIRTVYLLPVDEVSFLTNFIYAMFLCEIYVRLFYKKSFLLLGNSFLILLVFSFFVFSVYLQGMRLGTITFSMTSAFFLMICIVQMNTLMYKKILLTLAILLPIVFLVHSNIKNDKRWDSLFETIQIVWDNDSLYWLNHNKFPCPKLKNGQCVDRSNYIRPAQQLNGYKLILDYPLGVGYSRYAYQNALNQKYDNSATGGFAFPHSGMINLLIGLGIPGIIFYIVFFIIILKHLGKANDSYIKFFTIFIIIAFHFRALIDMTFMNHNLKVFLFLLGIGLAGSLLSNSKKFIKDSSV